MTVFLDSSALVKRYVDEVDSDRVRSLDGELLMSELAQVEVPSAFWRKHRMGEIDAVDARLLLRQFAHECGPAQGPLITIAVSPPTLARAAELVARHPLRAYDAVQLACALMVKDALDTCRFLCFDDRLTTAAVIEGLEPAW